MANLTRAQMIDRVLEHIGVKPTGQSSSAEDAVLVGEALDSAHDRLRKLGLAPFATSAIPTWAQIPFRDYISGDVGRSYGLGDSLKPGQVAAERELGRQVAGYKHNLRIRTEYF